MNLPINLKDRKTQLIIGGIILAIVAFFLIRRWIKKGKNEDSDYPDPENTVTPDGLKDATYPLQPRSLAGSYSADKGSMGTQIQFLQKLYNENLTTGTPLATDGKYGPKTLGAFLGFFGNEIASNGVITEAQYDQIVKKHFTK